ncbi:hypothetical protein [Streptomyces sp. NBC_01353]|uniref:hypothetical protein n=1 Tax=Streptomyces sp. NBC_01353 TaxID=2903835 RepID=UPI002E30478F|nr:hypothetical protein [Streptomyces sp. NBC_01353]
MASHTSDQITLISAAVAGALITQQVWVADASLFTTATVALFAATNVAWTINALRRNRTKTTVSCPQLGCRAQAVFSGEVKADEQVRLITAAVDHSRHGGAQ